MPDGVATAGFISFIDRLLVRLVHLRLGLPHATFTKLYRTALGRDPAPRYTLSAQGFRPLGVVGVDDVVGAGRSSDRPGPGRLCRGVRESPRRDVGSEPVVRPVGVCRPG